MTTQIIHWINWEKFSQLKHNHFFKSETIGQRGTHQIHKINIYLGELEIQLKASEPTKEKQK